MSLYPGTGMSKSMVNQITPWYGLTTIAVARYL